MVQKTKTKTGEPALSDTAAFEKIVSGNAESLDDEELHTIALMAVRREGYDTATWAAEAIRDPDERNQTFAEIAVKTAQHGDFEQAEEFVEQIEAGRIQEDTNYRLGLVATGEGQLNLGAAYRDTLPSGWGRDELTMLLGVKAAQDGQFDRCETILTGISGVSKTGQVVINPENVFPFKTDCYRQIVAAAGAAGEPETVERFIQYLRPEFRESGYGDAIYVAANAGRFETAIQLLPSLEDSWQRSQVASAVRRHALDAEQPKAARQAEKHIRFPGLRPETKPKPPRSDGTYTEDHEVDF